MKVTRVSLYLEIGVSPKYLLILAGSRVTRYLPETVLEVSFYLESVLIWPTLFFKKPSKTPFWSILCQCLAAKIVSVSPSSLVTLTGGSLDNVIYPKLLLGSVSN